MTGRKLPTSVLPSVDPGTTLPPRSLGGLISISLFWFAVNFHWTALSVFIEPPQIISLLYRTAPGTTSLSRTAWVNDNKALALAVVVGPGLIVALIANPLFGLLSDHTSSRFGRRRPYILGGTALNIAGLATMAFLPTILLKDGSGTVLSPALLALTGGLMLTQLGNNAAAAPFHALLPDLVPAQQRGTASGIMGLAYWFGIISSGALPFIFAFDYSKLLDGTVTYSDLQQQILLAYCVIAAVMTLMALLTVISVREQPWHSNQRSGMYGIRGMAKTHTVRELIITIAAVVGGVALLAAMLRTLHIASSADSVQVLQLAGVVIAAIGAARAFDFRLHRNPDFSWVLATRFLMMMGISILQPFAQYYLRDVAHVDPSTGASEFLILLTIGATVSGVFGGWASDRVGRKRMVYISGGFTSLASAAFALAPYIVPGHVFALVLGAGAVFGLSFGMYITVDWALLTDVLPNEATFARDMGVWNISLTVPQVLAVVFGAWLLTWFSYSSLGYSALFMCLTVFAVLGTVTVRNIKGVRQ
jgi:MFS family permease